ncbi:hypothetical protein [Chryseobacterium sp. PMSZPI]|uniref:hypothetical protein n=1 Tax=Chryseobacterium sp. PMSZPI TaxID=1033900 RepID=UPI001607D5D6|nr:hypothetical protein [Chryseobacterium sp. PMSZPI]
MKKQNQDKKKLSFKKLQLIKINSMKTINGGNGNNFNDPTDPTIRETIGQQ